MKLSNSSFLKVNNVMCLLQVLRKKYPQFAQQHNGAYMQQVLFSVMSHEIPVFIFCIWAFSDFSVWRCFVVPIIGCRGMLDTAYVHTFSISFTITRFKVTNIKILMQFEVLYVRLHLFDFPVTTFALVIFCWCISSYFCCYSSDFFFKYCD